MHPPSSASTPYPFPKQLKALKQLGRTPQLLAVTRSFLSACHHWPHHTSFPKSTTSTTVHSATSSPRENSFPVGVFRQIRVLHRILNHRSYSSDSGFSIMWHIINMIVMWWKNWVYSWFLYLFYYFSILRDKLFDDTHSGRTTEQGHMGGYHTANYAIHCRTDTSHAWVVWLVGFLNRLCSQFFLVSLFLLHTDKSLYRGLYY